MFKIIYCMRRKPGITREQFLAHWLSVHGPIVVEHQSRLRIARYLQTTPLEDEFSTRVERRGVLQPAYDGVAELYWASDADFRHAFTDSEALRILDGWFQADGDFCQIHIATFAHQGSLESRKKGK